MFAKRNTLLIDVGNSAVKWMNTVEGAPQIISSFFYTLDDLELLLNQKIIEQKYSLPDTVLVSNVAGMMVKQKLSQWCEYHYRLTPLFPQPSEQACGLTNSYETPSKLGVDRWLALIGAININRGPICVVDCGTAVTIDSVDEYRRFIGGVILPGLYVMQQSLLKNTNEIVLSDTQEKESVFALNTGQGVAVGAMQAITASIEQMVEKLQIIQKQRVACLVTGGDAKKITPHLSISVQYADNLVLRGLYLWGKESGLVI